MEKAKISAVLHTVSALYFLLLLVLGISIAGAKFVFPWEPWLLIPIGSAAMLLETYAAVAQWRSSLARRSLSVVLHFLFAAAVFTMITVEYARAQPPSVGDWFAANNYLFVSLLALARMFAGVSLMSDKISHP